MTPEQKARQEIDAQLAASGWGAQDYKVADFTPATRHVRLGNERSLTHSAATGEIPSPLWGGGGRRPDVVRGVGRDLLRRKVRCRTPQRTTKLVAERKHLPKTLIFAKDDTHADDIVRLCREVFGKGNDFCQKITYRTGFTRIPVGKKLVDGKEIEVFKWERTASLTPEQILSAFRNSYNPRIAVTVDMIATGTDIKPLEIVFFMRSVASKNFFEQMKGRGVRVVSDTEMEQVNPGVKRKTRYLIVDAVGVTERVHTESRPLEKKPTVSFEKLILISRHGNGNAIISKLCGAGRGSRRLKPAGLCKIKSTILCAREPAQNN